jgi:hypothetical protein
LSITFLLAIVCVVVLIIFLKEGYRRGEGWKRGEVKKEEGEERMRTGF